MQKGNINFKQIRKKVTQNPPSSRKDENNQNIPTNPTHKVSFRGIKKNQENTLTVQTQSKKMGYYYHTPLKPETMKNGSGVNTSRDREDCNKFSILLESKGYSNCNSGRKKSGDLSFRNLVGNASNGNRSNQNCSIMNNSSQYRINTERNERNESQSMKAEIIQQKCKQIKQKSYFSTRPMTGQLNSLNKLKNKLISPLKRQGQKNIQKEKKEIKKQVKQTEKQKQKVIHIFEHSSILSQHDLVNMSKTNDSIDFDMSPCL